MGELSEKWDPLYQQVRERLDANTKDANIRNEMGQLLLDMCTDISKRHLRSVLYSSRAVDDIVQIAALRLLRKIDEGMPIKQITSYAAKIMRNLAINTIQRNKFHQYSSAYNRDDPGSIDIPDDSCSPHIHYNTEGEPILYEPDEIKLLLEVIDKVEAKYPDMGYARILQNHYLTVGPTYRTFGMRKSFEEMAEALNINPGTLRSRHNSARGHFNRILEEYRKAQPELVEDLAITLNGFTTAKIRSGTLAPSPSR